jgi:hypothetical protein
MIVRNYEESDLEQIKRLHRHSGHGYTLPSSLSGEEFVSRRIACDENQLGMAAFLRLTAESYLICDPDWRNPAWRMEALRQLTDVCRKDAMEHGVKEVNAFLVPKIEKQFGKRLLRMGWKRYGSDEWKCYSYEV